MNEHPKPTSPKIRDVHCLQLRHKGMYVPANGDSHQDQFLDPYDASHYWCVYTQRGIGPDGQPVNRENCREGRECCEH